MLCYPQQLSPPSPPARPFDNQHLSYIAVVVMFVSTQDHSSERSEAQITGTNHRYPLSFFAYHKFHSPERQCRPYYYAPFVQNIRNFLMIWCLATLPDTPAWPCGQKSGRRSEYPV
jgi:hypothetical protein